MRIISALFILIVISLKVSAQAPSKMSYQAVVRNASNALVVNAPVKMRVSILQGSATATAVYTELHNPTTNTNGLATIEIGGGTTPSGSFTGIDWSKGPFFIKNEVDPAGGSNYTIVGTVQLLSVPFSLYSQSTSLKYSSTGDTLFSGNQYIIVPGISGANLPSQGQGLPSISTSPATNVTNNSAVLGGNISSQGTSQVTTRGICYSLTSSPTTANFTVSAGSGTGSFQANLTNLVAGTNYYARAFAINSGGTSYGNQVMFTTTGGLVGNCTGTVRDIDGNEYGVVQIGNQCWMKENLRVTRFRNGDNIPLDISGGISGDSVNQTWGTLSTAARTLYNHNQSLLLANGYLYNKYAAQDARGVCPVGWHLPTEQEFITLAEVLGGELVAGGKMKSTGTSLWKAPNEGADNSSGFTGLPSGYRGVFSGKFMGKNEAAVFWTNTEGVNSIVRELHYDSRALRTPYFVSYNSNPPNGVSIRCIRD
jgi:uncharacterized protein (TIGR02145 family)